MKENIKDIIIQSVSALPHKLSLAHISCLGDAAQLQYAIGDHVLDDVLHACAEISAGEDYEIYKDEFYDLVGQDAENAWSNACKLSVVEDGNTFDLAVQIAGSFDIAFSTILEEQELN